jgi:hypothetical protein
MKISLIRWLIWVGVGLLSALLMVSCIRDTTGVDTYHEVNCDDAEPAQCAPSGRYIVLVRKPADVSVNPPRQPAMAVETYSANGLLESRVDQVRCVMSDPNNVVCRDVLMAIASSSRPNTAPWRLVQGRLLNNGVDPNRVRYLDGLAMWRNRLTLGNYEQ